MRRLIIMIITFSAISVDSVAAEDYWVTSERLERRTCPSTSCGVVGQLFFREKATVLETSNGWGRLTGFYDAACKDGISQYVDTGRKNCTKENGIVDGRFAEWALLRPLSKERPPDPAAGTAGDAALVAGSDDYRLYKEVFIKAAKSLIGSRTCTEAEFRDAGGWTKSTNYRDRPIYFVYCGGMTVRNRVYLDVSNGNTFK